MDLQKKKLIILFLSIILLICSITPVLARTHKAEGRDDWYVDDKWDDVFEWGISVYSTDSKEVQQVQDIINFVPPTDNDGNAITTTYNNSDTFDTAKYAIWNMIVQLYDALKTTGFLFVILYFLIDLMDKTTHDNFNVEHFIRQIIKLLVAIIIINNGMKLLVYAFQLSSAFINSVTSAQGQATISSNQNATSYATAKLQEMANNLKNTSLGAYIAAIGYRCTLLIPWLGIKIAQVIILYMCWSRFIEIGLRAAFAPIGMADMFSNGLHGSGFRYFKKLCAVVLQGMFILAVVLIVQQINAAFAYQEGLEFFSRFVLLFAEIGLIKKSQSLANDLLGV